MGVKSSKKKLRLSQPRMSLKKGWKRRRKQLRLLAAQNAANIQKAESENKVTDNQCNIQPQADAIKKTDLVISSEKIHYFNLPIKEEVEDNNDNHDNHDIHDMHDIVNHIKEEVEISEDIYENAEICEDIYEYYEYDEDVENSNNKNIEDYKNDINNSHVSYYNKEKNQYEEESMYNGNIKYNNDHKDLVIGSKQLINLYCIKRNIPNGRYIVDISFIFNEIHRTFDDHARGIKCQFKDWQLINSRRRGLLTQFFFKCLMCNYETSIWSEPTEMGASVSSTLDINAAAVIGSSKLGIGFTRLKDLCASMDIACMSDKTYRKYRENLVNKSQDSHVKLMNC